jgi:hypothetical protein
MMQLMFFVAFVETAWFESINKARNSSIPQIALHCHLGIDASNEGNSAQSRECP